MLAEQMLQGKIFGSMFVPLTNIEEYMNVYFNFNLYPTMGGMVAKLVEIYDSFTKPASICIIGLDGAGKTHVLYALSMGQPLDNSIPTIGFNVETIQCKSTTIQAWDLGGQNRLREMWSYYYDEVSGIIFVVDSVDKDRFDEARIELQRILTDKRLENIPVLVLANKQDVRGYAASVDDVKNALGINNYMMKDIHIVGCSALRNERVVLGMEWLANHIK